MRATILSAVLTALAAAASAQGFTPMATAPAGSVPGGMNYQGRLEQNGFPVTGSRPIVFRLFDVATGGSALWTSGSQNVAITQGLFSASLDIPFAMLTGASQKYLELQVDGVTLAPRDPIGSVPYAKVAETVEGTIDVSTAGLTFTTPVGDSLAISSVSGRVGIGLSNPAARLHVSSGAGETSSIVIVSTGSSTLLTIDGNGKVKANSFEGDGTTLGNVVRKSGDGMTGPLTINSPSTLTVLGSAFSVGSTDLVVGSNRTGVGTAAPLATLSVAGDLAVTQPATFGASVTVKGAAQFGAGATVSAFSAAGALALDSNASLSVGTTFFVNNGRVGVGTASPSASSRLNVVGDVLLGSPGVHDTSANSDLIIDGNLVLDGKFVQHGGAASVFDILGVAAEPQAGQTFAVGYTSFVVLSNGNVGVATLSPLAKLTVNGDSSFISPGTFGSSLTVRAAAQFGSSGFSVFNTAGALAMASGQDITMSGAGAEVLGLPATPSATGAASKEYVDSQTLVGSGWTRDAANTELELSFIGDEVGVGTASPLAKLHVAGDMSVTQPATFGSSVTVREAASFGTSGQSSFSNTGVLTLGTALAVGSGGTGATTAGNARTNLGLVIGTDVQAFDADLSDLADGGIAGSKVDLSTVTTALAGKQNLDADLTDLADGGIDGSKVDLSTITTALSGKQNLDADLTDLADGGIDGSKVDLSTVTTAINTHAALTGTSAHGAASANTASAIVARDASGNFAAGTVTASGLVMGGGLRLFSRTFVNLMATTPAALGEVYYCSDCGLTRIAVSTGTAAPGQFASASGGNIQ